MKKATIYTNDFNRVIEATKSFTTNNNKEIFQYIKLEFDADASTMTAIAIDGYRMSVEHAVISDCKESFTVYVKGTLKLPRSKYAEISIVGDDVIIRCDGLVFGFQQPEGDYIAWEGIVPTSDVKYKIAFNGNYLLSALQAAKASCGNFKEPVILEFRGRFEPIVLRTNKKDIKLVLPMRVYGDD